MTVTIAPATIRDVSFIASNLRPADRRELLCQMPPGIDAATIAALCVHPGSSFVAYDDGHPAMAFGLAPLTLAGNVLSAWAFGTRRAARTIAEIGRFLADWDWDGVTLVTAWSLASHTVAHRWMQALGARLECSAPWGRDGEMFHLFAWRADSLPAMRETANVLHAASASARNAGGAGAPGA